MKRTYGMPVLATVVVLGMLVGCAEDEPSPLPGADGSGQGDAGLDVEDASGDLSKLDQPGQDAPVPDGAGPPDGAGGPDGQQIPDGRAPELCVASCEGKECGDDGCGGECGKCPAAAPVCVEGLCQVECIPDCEGLECGDDGCGSECGQCPAAAPVCVEGLCEVECIPDCEGLECGDDGCEGNCGACAEGFSCDAGLCVEDCVSDEGCEEAGQTSCTEDGFGYFTCEEVEPGCLKWSEEPTQCELNFACQEGECLQVCFPDCTGRECGDDGCGILCGLCGELEQCSAAGLCECLFETCADLCCPAGQICFAAACCQSSCEGKECGDDGCGGACGKCGLNEVCGADFQCACEFEACDGVCCPAGEVCFGQACCAPQCAGKECGDDACGGWCGACDELAKCTADGHCACQFAACGQTCCEQGEICFDETCCQADCAGKVCGDDGCGGSCGKCGQYEVCNNQFQCVCPFVVCGAACCGAGETCQGGKCIPPCVPDCAGKECGNDGCGGSCGKCFGTSICDDKQQCIDLCEYNCVGKVCGSDKCGGSCGTCEAGFTCSDAGLCVQGCQPNCAGKVCGGNGCGGSCGTCANGTYCNAGKCTPQCTPDCFLKECGPDGCGGQCGTCEAGVLCTAAGSCGSQCLECDYQPECFDIDFSAGTLASFNIDAATLVTTLGGTQAPTGGHMLKLTTGEGLTQEKSSAVFQTCLPAGGYGVIVDWKFYSEEFKEYCGSIYQDSMKITLEMGGQVMPVDAVAINDLCPKTAGCAACGSHFLGLEDSDVSFDKGDVWNTPWTVSIAGFEVKDGANTVSLRIALTDAGDVIFDSVLLVDRIRFLPCDQFCTAFDCGANPPCQCDSCPVGGICTLGECCVPTCEGKKCGDNGCGGSCGTCTQLGAICYNGACCVPDCLGNECGSDGCGGSCGQCFGPQEACQDGQCVCVSACEGKQCGPDGCGSVCGICDDGKACSKDSCAANGACVFDVSLCCDDNADCNDGNACTADSCAGGTCLFQPIGGPGCCAAPIFEDDFSTDKGWTKDLTWQVGPAVASPPLWTFNPDPAQDHSSSADNMLAGVLIGGNTEKTIHGYYFLTSPAMDISKAANPHVFFWRMLNSDYPTYMTNTIQAWNGVQWISLWTQTGTSWIVDAMWTLVDFNVTPYKNAAFRFRIGYKVDSQSVYSCPSWSVDDVTVLDVTVLQTQTLCCDMLSDCQGPVPAANQCLATGCK